MIRRLNALWIALILCAGCSSTRIIDVNDDVGQNAVARAGVGRTARVVYVDGRSDEGRDVRVHADSTYWKTLGGHARVSIPTSRVREIVLRNTGRGALEGAGIGLLMGALAGAALGYGSSYDNSYYDPGSAVAFGAGAVGAAGLVLGTAIGTGSGHRDRFVLTHPASEASVAQETASAQPVATVAPDGTVWSEVGEARPTRAAPATKPDTSNSIGLHFQFGVHLGVQTIRSKPTDRDQIVTADLAALRWNGRENTWGLGARVSARSRGSDPSIRLGLKGLWRVPLGLGGKSYFQLAPGLTVYAEDDSKQAHLPGYFVEAELGIPEFALVATVEKIDFTYLSFGGGEKSGQDIASYLGVKVGQGPGLATAIVALGIAAAIASSFQGFGSGY